MTWYSAPAPRRLPLWAKVVIGTALAATVGCVLFVAAVVVSFSGGLDDVLDVRNPHEDSREVQRARDRAATRAEDLRAEVLLALDATPLADTGVRVERDDCSVGQHNWKIDDPYDLDCSLARASVHVAGTDPLVDPGAAVAALDLLLQGWDREVTEAPEAAWTRGTDSLPGAQRVSLTLVRSGTRPLAGYDLGAGYAAPGEPTGITRDGKPYGADRVRAEHPGRQLVLVTVTEEYFYE